MDRQRAMALVRQIQAERLRSIVDSRGRLKLSTLIRINEMKYPKRENAIRLLVRYGVAESEDEVARLLHTKEVQCQVMPGTKACLPQPMSDYVLDVGAHYLSISHELFNQLRDL